MQKISFRYLDIITALFAAILIFSNITSAKILSLGWFSFDGGTIIFPLAYVLGAVLTEVYGYARARRVIWVGFALNLLMVVIFYTVGQLPPALDWPYQESYMNILGVVPRIVLASLTAYLVGEFMNSYVLAKLKIKTQGKQFWLRAITANLIGEFLDTTIFISIAFLGALPLNLILTVWVSNYIFKNLTEIILLPLTSRVVRWLKKKEELDFYDTQTNFNPLRID